MPDVITAAERAAIDAYRGPVNRIPRGVSSEGTYSYDEASTASGGLVTGAGITHREWLREQTKASHRRRIRSQQFYALRRREGRE